MPTVRRIDETWFGVNEFRLAGADCRIVYLQSGFLALALANLGRAGDICRRIGDGSAVNIGSGRPMTFLDWHD